MAQIGSFKQTGKGYEGTIATLHLDRKVKFIANENKKSKKALTILSNPARAISARPGRKPRKATSLWIILV